MKKVQLQQYLTVVYAVAPGKEAQKLLDKMPWSIVQWGNAIAERNLAIALGGRPRYGLLATALREAAIYDDQPGSNHYTAGWVMLPEDERRAAAKAAGKLGLRYALLFYAEYLADLGL